MSLRRLEQKSKRSAATSARPHSPLIFGAGTNRGTARRVDGSFRLQLLVNRNAHPDPGLGGGCTRVHAEADAAAEKFVQRIVRIACSPEPQRPAGTFHSVIAP